MCCYINLCVETNVIDNTNAHNSTEGQDRVLFEIYICTMSKGWELIAGNFVRTERNPIIFFKALLFPDNIAGRLCFRCCRPRQVVDDRESSRVREEEIPLLLDRNSVAFTFCMEHAISRASKTSPDLDSVNMLHIPA